MNGNRKSETLATICRDSGELDAGHKATGYKRKGVRSDLEPTRTRTGAPINVTTMARDADGRWPWQIPPDPMGPVKLPARWRQAWFERTGDARYVRRLQGA